MNIKKTLISVGLSAALSALPLIAQADLISQTAIVKGVDVLAKSSSKLPNQKLVLTENTAGAVNDQLSTSPRDIVLSLDNGAKFVSATVIWKAQIDEATTVKDNKLIAKPDDDGNLVIKGIILNIGASLGILTVRDIFIDTTKTEVGKVVKISLNTDLTTATGTDFPALKIATVVDSDVVIKNASGIIPKIQPGRTGYIRDIIISENASGAIATERTPKTIVMTLPSDWKFVGKDAEAPYSGHGIHTATPAQKTPALTATEGPSKNDIDGFFLDCKEAESDTTKCKFHVDGDDTTFQNPSTESKLYIDVDGGNENPGKIVLGGGKKPTENNTDKNLGDMQVKAPKNASKGEYFATVTVELFNGKVKTKKVKIAEIVEPGIKATVVDFKTDDFDLEPVKDTTIPEYPRGFLDAILDAVMVVENYGDSLTTGDTLTLTLPTGVVFSSDWLAAAQEENDVAGGKKTESNIKDPVRFCVEADYKKYYNDRDTTTKEPFCAELYITNPSNPKGFSFVTMTFDRAHTAAKDDKEGGLLIGGNSSLLVNINDNAKLGDLVVKLSGKVGGKTLTPIDLTLAKVVEGGTKNEAVLAEGESVPTHGIGSSGRTISKFTITELVNGTLRANNSTITLTLPEGITWNKVPQVETTNLKIAVDSEITNSDRTVTLKVTTGSVTSIGIITVKGDDQLINISADYKPGDINIEFGGNAGVAKTKLLVAKAAKGTRLEVLEVTKLIAGKATQKIASIRVIENFKGALAANGKFRLILPKGFSWAPAVPKTPTVLADGEKGNKLTDEVDEKHTYDSGNDINEGAWDEKNTDADGKVILDADGNFTYPNTDSWEFEISTTFNNKDTLVIQVPSVKSTGATIVPINGLKVNVDPAVKDGTIKVTIDDGNTAGKDGAGVTEEDAVIGYIGDLPEFKVDPLTVKVAAGDTVTVKATGGLGTANISKAPDEKIATATALNGVITITGVAEGKTSIEISDGTSKKQTKTVEIEITPAAELSVPKTAKVAIGKTTEIKITGGGKVDLTVESSDDKVVTATLKDKTLILKGIKIGDAKVTIKAGEKTFEIAVSVKKTIDTTPIDEKLPTAGGKDGKASGINSKGEVVTTEAKFYGGVSTDGGTTYSTEITAEQAITVKVKIEVDPAHKDKKGKYYVVAGYQQDAAAAPLWWFYKEDKSFVDWSPVDLATRVPYKATDALGAIEITIVDGLSLKDFKGKYSIFLAYETEDGSIFFNLPAIEFEQK
jgi:hypothetical protein